MSAESTKEATAEGHKVTSVETPSVPKQEVMERIEGIAGPGADPPPPRIIDSGLVLVRAGSPAVLRFDQFQALQAGMAAPLTCHASHPGNGVGTKYPEERMFGEWRSVWTSTSVSGARQFFTKSFLGDGAAVLARSSGEERAPPRHRASVASMAWRTT